MSLLVDIRKEFQGFSLNMQLETEDKEVLGILGESGSGKSMTLRCIAGIVKPDSGKIVLNGKTLFDSEKGINLPPRSRNVGLMFQNYALFPHMTVEQNIAAGVRDKQKHEAQIAKMLRLLHLEGLETRRPWQLSGGQQQRVALARMMAAEPEILLLDEPFSALDGRLRQEIESDFAEALDTFTGPAVLVSHNFNEIYRYSTRTAVVSGGKKVEEGGTKSLLASPERIASARLLCCPNLAKLDNSGYAPDWNLHFEPPAAKEGCAWVGIFGGDIEFCAEWDGFPVKIREISETLHEATVRLEMKGAREPLYTTCSKTQAEKALQLSSAGALFAKLPATKLLFLQD